MIYTEQGTEMNRGRAIDENWLAQKLRPYGVRPRTVRIGERMAKGYVGLELRDVFRRYIPHSEVYAGFERLGIDTKEEVATGGGESRED